MTSLRRLSGPLLTLMLPCVTVAITVPSYSQQTSQDAGAITLKVSSRLTLVDVVATDSKGQSVHGLTRSDFIIKEDGKPQPIQGFEEHDSEETKPLNIFLLNSLGVLPENQKFSQQLAEKYLKTMPSGTKVAILELSRDGLRALQETSSDPVVLLHAVEAMTIVPVDWISTSDDQKHCSQFDMTNRMRLEALDQIAVNMSAIKGRKNLIWFLDTGNPTITDAAFRKEFNDHMALPHGTCLSDYTMSLRKTYGLLTAAEVAVYSISTAGSTTSDQQRSIESFSAATGGEGYTRYAKEPIIKAIENGANYYSVSYVPPTQAYDGKYHTITVEVSRPGVHLSYRKGYNADDMSTMR